MIFLMSNEKSLITLSPNVPILSDVLGCLDPPDERKTNLKFGASSGGLVEAPQNVVEHLQKNN